MNEHRKLAAIMFTDIVGYSALTQKNEALAQRLLQTHNELLRSIFSDFKGNEIKSIGDAFLVEFASALDAMLCAVKIQTTLNDYNSKNEDSITIRIGIHLGDIIVRDNDVFGDGVNIAARIEPAAVPGGICISEDVARQVKNKIDYQLVQLPERQLRNIQIPIQLFAVQLPWMPAIDIEHIAIKKSNGPLGERHVDDTSRQQSPIERMQPSIAVLPFANLSADPENEYFSDGMSEEIINALTKVNGLHVVARTSAFAFKGKGEDIREIGKKLHVEHVLEGSVRKAGNRLRITAQLINVTDGYHLWSERFDREMEDIFAIQDEISLSIVNKLRVTLLEVEKGALVKRSTENLQAYNLLLQGRYSFHKSTLESLRSAIERYQEAVALSPDYAQAYVEMAVAYHLLGLLDYLPARDVYPKARASALKALEIDPKAAEAYAVLATVNLNYDWDWERAESAFRKAIELNSNAANVRVQYAMFLVYHGRMNESLAEMSTAYSLDPLLAPTFLGFILLRMGKLDEARVQFQKTLESEPEGTMAPWLLGHVDVLQGRHEEGLSEIQRALSLSGNNAIILAGLGWSNAVAGRRNEAIRVLEELHERSRREYIGPVLSAKIYSALGENDLAFEWLEMAYKEHDSSLVAILNDESFRGLHEDPRFSNLLKKMKLTV